MVETTLMDAIELARAGRKAEARELLDRVLQGDRANETAWLWLADCAETREDSIQALETCLRYLPNASRPRAALEILRFEGPHERRSNFLADRLLPADKNIKSQPRDRFEAGKSVVSQLQPDLEKLRQDLPANWIPVLPEESLPEQEPALTDDGLPPDEAVPEEELPATYHTPLDQRPKGFWQVDSTPQKRQLGEPADPFLISPDLFTPEELVELEKNLGVVQVARRRVSLKQDPHEAWQSLSSLDVPTQRRVAPKRSRQIDVPPVTRLLLYVLLAGALVVLVSVLLILAAFLLRGL